jgi:hypothetical protein
MQTQKAYILKINTPISNEYAGTCVRSCNDVKLKSIFVDGYQDMFARLAWLDTGIKMGFDEQFAKQEGKISKGDLCSAGHGKIWKMIADGPEQVGIVLEHDAIMLHALNVDIPDGYICVLGYKLKDPKTYLHMMAGPPSGLMDIAQHEGAHAYAMTKKTAQMLIDEIEQHGRPLGCIDNAYFLKGRKTKIPLKLVVPTPAIGWIRESTIWGQSATRNYPFVPQFKDFLQT